MKIYVHISKTANLFFFIFNLSEWNLYNRKKYNDEWTKHARLSKREKFFLKKVKNVLQRKKNVIPVIFSAKSDTEIRSKVNKLLSKDEKVALLEAAEFFFARFEKIWKRECGSLEKIKQILSKPPPSFNKAFFSLKKLYDNDGLLDKLEIYLFTSPVKKHAVSGGQGLGRNKIMLECSRITKQNNKKQMLLRVILHELIHASSESKVKRHIKKYINSAAFKNEHKKEIFDSHIYKQTKSVEGVIKEMIAVSLLPEGYLGEKYFDFDVLKNLRKRSCIKSGGLKKTYYDLMLFSVWKLYDIAKRYTDEKKPIDIKFFESAVEAWKSFEEVDLSKLRI